MESSEIARLTAELAAERERAERELEEERSAHSQTIGERDEFEEAFDELVGELGVETEYSNCRLVKNVLEDAIEAVATLTRQRNEMAAALERAQEHASWCETHHGGICDCGQPIIVDDPSAILAARDKAQRRAGAVARLKWWAEALPTFHHFESGADHIAPADWAIAIVAARGILLELSRQFELEIARIESGEVEP